MAIPIPPNLDWAEAGAVPEAFITAHDALVHQAHLVAGESVLIHAVASGVGTAALQIAKAMGCTVYGTSRTAAKLELALGLGLDLAIDTSHEDFVTVLKSATSGAGVAVVMDHLGGPTFAGSLECLEQCGRLVVVGFLAGRRVELDLAALLRKRATLVGTTLRSRPIEEKIAASRRFARSVVPWLERGLVRPVVDRTYTLDEIRPAQERMDSNVSSGKIVILP
jgi:NADPH:quinone reductase-like Zn-dependent oxidoreductase